jgi:hypothetical protein
VLLMSASGEALQLGSRERLPNPFTAFIDAPLPPDDGPEPASVVAVVGLLR